MGDAGPPTPLPEDDLPTLPTTNPSPPPRKIHVLVTGFGPFKTFSNNPSWLIARSLPRELDPAPPLPLLESKPATRPEPQVQPQTHPLASFFNLRHPSQQEQKEEPVQQPLRPPNNTPYEIVIHTYPHPIRVAYTPTSVLIPSLLDPATNGTAFPHPSHPSHPPQPSHDHGIDFDYILHIGLASGRNSYTLETSAHRDGYMIHDVDEDTGFLGGEKVWKGLRPVVPGLLNVGWDGRDVLRRWEGEVGRREEDEERKQEREEEERSRRLEEARREQERGGSGGEEKEQRRNREQEKCRRQEQEEKENLQNWMAQHGMLLRPNTNIPSTGAGGEKPPAQTPNPISNPIRKPRKAVVKLSRDAGRFLCEFILMCSLVYRWRQAQLEQSQSQAEQENVQAPIPLATPAPTPISKDNISGQDGRRRRVKERAKEKLGKVAFLHVPNGTDDVDIDRGRMVAESAIRAIVGSWEAGWRNPGVYKVEDVVVAGVEQEGVEAGTEVGAGQGVSIGVAGDGSGSGFEITGTGDR